MHINVHTVLLTMMFALLVSMFTITTVGRFTGDDRKKRRNQRYIIKILMEITLFILALFLYI